MKRVCLKWNQFLLTLEKIAIRNVEGNKVDVSGVEKKECVALKVLKVVIGVRLDSKTDAMEHSVEKQDMNAFWNQVTSFLQYCKHDLIFNWAEM